MGSRIPSSTCPHRALGTGVTRYLAVLLILLAGCCAVPRTAVQALHESWTLLEPYARAGIEADATLAPESKAIRMRNVEAHGQLLEELSRGSE